MDEYRDDDSAEERDGPQDLPASDVVGGAHPTGYFRNRRAGCAVILLTVGALTVFVKSCGFLPGDENKPSFKRLRGNFSYLHTELPSAHDLITVDEFARFVPGKPMADILNEIQWKGNSEEAVEYNGEEIAAIEYRLFVTDPEIPDGSVVWAMFRQGNFEKFVVAPNGRDRSIGDFSKLTTAWNSPPISVADLQHATKSVPSSYDPGLTIVALLLSPAIYAVTMREAAQAASDDDYRRNVELRHQYCAARIRIGMSADDVMSVLGAKPLESGTLEVGTYRIYGSIESFKIEDYLHYTNVLVIFQDERVVGWYSAPGSFRGGEQGLAETREWFTNLPPRNAEAPQSK